MSFGAIGGALVGGLASGVVGGLLGGGSGGGGRASAADGAQAGSIAQQTQISAEMYERYKAHTLPILDQIEKDAMQVDSAENQEKVAGAAHADNTSSFENARQTAIERLRSMGVNPASEKFAALANDFAAKEGASDVAAQNTARTNLQNTGRTYRAAVAGLGVNVPGQAASGFNTAATQYGNMAATARSNSTAQNQAIGSFLSPVIGGVKNWFGNQTGQTPGYGVNDYGVSMSGPGAFDSMGDNYTGYSYDGSYAYGADGGLLVGPPHKRGGVHLEAEGGEMVIPKDVVRAKGVEFFNKLIQNYHTPAGRRGVARR